MFDSVRRHSRTVLALGAAGALAVTGVAVAQGGSSGSPHGRLGPPRGKRMPPPGPIGGSAGRDLTYAQLHVRRDGRERVIRIDRGKVVAVGDSAITLSENDGSEVTIAVDEGTRVLDGPRHKSSVTDLEAGQEVLVSGPEDSAAKAILVPPRPGRMTRGARRGQRRGQLPPPPSGGPQMKG